MRAKTLGKTDKARPIHKDPAAATSRSGSEMLYVHPQTLYDKLEQPPKQQQSSVGPKRSRSSAPLGWGQGRLGIPILRAV